MRWIIALVIGFGLMGCVGEAVELEPTMRIVVGKTADFSEQITHFHAYENDMFPQVFIVNQNGRFSAFPKLTPNFDLFPQCELAWIDSLQYFGDSCWGTHFNINGEYAYGPAYKNLDRYPVEIINNNVYIDFGNIVEGSYIHPDYESIYWTKFVAEDNDYDSLEQYLEQAGYLPHTKDK